MSARPDFKGDYMGFTYGNKHSSDLGIVRVSDGSRFNENLLPTIQDKTVQIPGGDGTYYFGSYYTQRQFSVSFAFDSLTEEQLATLKSHFGDKKIHDLVFDERPYKTYRAKVTGTATLKYIPFGSERVYKGEGTLQFTCYQPFAICKKKWLNGYNNSNKNEWAAASRLKESSGNYDILSNGQVQLYNAGDVGANCQIRFNFNEDKNIPSGKIILSQNNQEIDRIEWGEILQKAGDVLIKFDSKTNLIEGYDASLKKTGNIYNEFIQKGTFFKIPTGESLLTVDGANFGFDIEYDYYYI